MHHNAAIRLGHHGAGKGILVDNTRPRELKKYTPVREGDVLRIRKTMTLSMTGAILAFGLSEDLQRGRVQTWGIPVSNQHALESFHWAMNVLRIYDGKTHVFPLFDAKRVSRDGTVTIGHVAIEVLRAR